MKASHFIQPWQPRELIRWKQNSKHCSYMTQGIDIYTNMCSGFKYNFGSLGGKLYQNASQTLCWSTHTNRCGCQPNGILLCIQYFNTLRTCDTNLRFYITTAQDGWHKSAFLTRACFPYTIRLTFRHRASCILGEAFKYSPENAFYIFNQKIYFIFCYLLDRASLI